MHSQDKPAPAGPRLAAQLEQAIKKELGRTAQTTQAKGYVRVASGKATLAYVNVQQKQLRLDVPEGKGQHKKLVVADEKDVSVAIGAMKARLESLAVPAKPAKPAPSRASGSSARKPSGPARRPRARAASRKETVVA
jgi:hypothetical protein